MLLFYNRDTAGLDHKAMYIHGCFVVVTRTNQSYFCVVLQNREIKIQDLVNRNKTGGVGISKKFEDRVTACYYAN